MQESLWQGKANGPLENNNTWIRYGIYNPYRRKFRPVLLRVYSEPLHIPIKEIIYQKGCSKFGLPLFREVNRSIPLSVDLLLIKMHKFTYSERNQCRKCLIKKLMNSKLPETAEKV